MLIIGYFSLATVVYDTPTLWALRMAVNIHHADQALTVRADVTPVPQDHLLA